MLRAFYLSMLRIRLVEECIADVVEAGEVKTPTHLYVGQEAIAVGVCNALRVDDYVYGNHRSHGHYLAKGGDLPKLMAEIYCRQTGCSRGRGGSMHLIAPEVGFLGTVPMVAATIPIAVGTALSCQMRGLNNVTVAFFGDGATEEGVFHEAVNFATLKRLPVLFVCENNFYSSHLSFGDRRPFSDLATLVEPYGLPSVKADGNDVLGVYSATLEAVARARAGEGPTFFEFDTYRWRGHVGPSFDLDVGIRSREELDAWMTRCPIKRLEQLLLSDRVMTAGEIVALRQQVEVEVAAALKFARESPMPDPAQVGTHVFAGMAES